MDEEEELAEDSVEKWVNGMKNLFRHHLLRDGDSKKIGRIENLLVIGNENVTAIEIILVVVAAVAATGLLVQVREDHLRRLYRLETKEDRIEIVLVEEEIEEVIEDEVVVVTETVIRREIESDVPANGAVEDGVIESLPNQRHLLLQFLHLKTRMSCQLHLAKSRQ